VPEPTAAPPEAAVLLTVTEEISPNASQEYA
jgi:hypothetical protein